MANKYKHGITDIALSKNITISEIYKLCPSLIKHSDLSPKQKAFIYYYCNNGCDKLDAVIKAGYTSRNKGAKKRRDMLSAAQQILYNVKIQNAIKEVLNDIVGIRKLALEHNIFTLLERVIELDICDYLDDQGNIKSKLSDIPKPIRQLIKKTEVKYYGKDAQIRVLTLDFLGKEWAIEKLMKYIAMIKDGDTNINIISDETKILLMNILMGKGDK